MYICRVVNGSYYKDNTCVYALWNAFMCTQFYKVYYIQSLASLNIESSTRQVWNFAAWVNSVIYMNDTKYVTAWKVTACSGGTRQVMLDENVEIPTGQSSKPMCLAPRRTWTVA